MELCNEIQVFQLVIFFKTKCILFIFSISDELEVFVLKRIEKRNSAGGSAVSNLAPPHDEGAGGISSSQVDRVKEIDTPDIVVVTNHGKEKLTLKDIIQA